MGRKNNHLKQKQIETETLPTSDDITLTNGNIARTLLAKKSNPQELVCCKHSDIFGRYLEAKTTIRKGTLIFSENILVGGPMRTSNLVCVGCHHEIADSTEGGIEAFKRCSKCQWPICQEKCMDSIYHQSECNFFVKNKIQAPNLEGTNASGEFGALTVLRALLLKTSNPEAWKTLNTLEHHNDARKGLDLWKENQTTVVDVIQNKWKLRNFFNSEDEIHTVCGILEVNSFELGDSYSFRGLFPKAAMLAHNCVPNTTYFIHNEEGRIDLRASIDIQKGTPLFLTYALSLQGTSLRQKSLREIKFFECCCERCSDPFELGMNLSTLKCQSCTNGLVTKEKTANNNWLCNNPQCNQSVSPTIVDALIRKYYKIWENLLDIKSYENFLQTCEPVFHSNHYIPFRVKFDLCQSYGREGVSNIHELSDNDLERKLTLCKGVLQVLDKITPGYIISRGWILHELQATELIICKRIFENGTFANTSEFRRKLVSTLKILLEVIEIFGFCDTSSIEYRICESAKKETLPGLQNWIDCFS